MNIELKQKREKAMLEYLGNQTNEGWVQFQKELNINLGGLEVTLKEKNPDMIEGKPRSVKITVFGDSDYLYIKPEGYGEFDYSDGRGDPVVMELSLDELTLVYCPDINDNCQESISLEGARESKRS